MTDETQKKENPTWKLVQDKAYYTIDKNGNRVRKTKTVDLTVGWDRVSKEGMAYISFADSVQSIEPDADGRVKLVLFPIKETNQA